MPHEMPPPSKAGPVATAQHKKPSPQRSAISPLVPTSTKSERPSSSRPQESSPAVMSPPT